MMAWQKSSVLLTWHQRRDNSMTWQVGWLDDAAVQVVGTNCLTSFTSIGLVMRCHWLKLGSVESTSHWFYRASWIRSDSTQAWWHHANLVVSRPRLAWYFDPTRTSPWHVKLRHTTPKLLARHAPDTRHAPEPANQNIFEFIRWRL